MICIFCNQRPRLGQCECGETAIVVKAIKGQPTVGERLRFIPSKNYYQGIHYDDAHTGEPIVVREVQPTISSALIEVEPESGCCQFSVGAEELFPLTFTTAIT